MRGISGSNESGSRLSTVKGWGLVALAALESAMIGKGVLSLCKFSGSWARSAGFQMYVCWRRGPGGPKMASVSATI